MNTFKLLNIFHFRDRKIYNRKIKYICFGAVATCLWLSWMAYAAYAWSAGMLPQLAGAVSVWVFYGNNILVRIKKDTWPEYECNVQAGMWPGPARSGTKSGKSRQTGAATGLKCNCQTRRLLLSLSPVAYLYLCLCLYLSCQPSQPLPPPKTPHRHHHHHFDAYPCLLSCQKSSLLLVFHYIFLFILIFKKAYCNSVVYLFGHTNFLNLDPRRSPCFLLTRLECQCPLLLAPPPLHLVIRPVIFIFPHASLTAA